MTCLCAPLWQLDLLLHSLTTALVPLHFFPPCAGSGLAHSLILACKPLTVLVQLLHRLHLLQPPSTYKIGDENSQFYNTCTTALDK